VWVGGYWCEEGVDGDGGWSRAEGVKWQITIAGKI
jgi:hypothetical protein